MDSTCTGKRQEEISQAFVRKISVNMMPISFCNSKGFKEFMNVLQPEYRCPCPKTIIKRLELIHNEKRMKIEQDIPKLSCIAMTNDG
jgi:CRISPR/Cas system-associated endonuclease Cas1